MELTYAFAMHASADELLQAVASVTASAEESKVQKLARNHGFLKGLMVRVGRHFRDAGAGAVRILKSGGVWYTLLATCAAAVMLLLDARQLRHFKMQPGLGKARVLGVGMSFLGFIIAFAEFFKRLATAWKGQAESPDEEGKAEALGTKMQTIENLAGAAQNQVASASAVVSVLVSAGVHLRYTT